MRIEKINNIRKKLNTGQKSIGTWQQIPDASISEILGKSDYDWVAIDLEHGSISKAQLPNLFRAIELGGTLPLARIAQPSDKDCKDALDAGAGGLIIPMIRHAKQLKLIVDACCWPPNGNRGVGFSRANLFGKNFKSYSKEAEAPLIIVQIENMDAVNNLEEILQINAIDAIIIGPYDLTASMGITGEFHNDKFSAMIKNISEIANKYGVPFGDHIVEPDLELLKQRIESGYTFIAYLTDAIFLHANCKNPRIE